MSNKRSPFESSPSQSTSSNGNNRRSGLHDIRQRKSSKPIQRHSPHNLSNNTVINSHNRTGKSAFQNNTKYSLKFCIIKTIVALFGGFIGYLLCENLYNALLYTLWTPLLVSIYVFIIAFSASFPIAVLSILKDERKKYQQYKNQLFKSNSDQNSSVKTNNSIMKYGLTLLVLFLSTMVLDFIYEQNFSSLLSTPSSYIFALDMSSSMIGNDSDHQLEPAVQNVVSQVDDAFPFAIYTFTEQPNCLRLMNDKVADSDVQGWNFNYDGGTDIISALELIIHDYHEQKANGSWKGGNTPKVLLMTDGEFGNPNIDALLNEFSNEGIVICTIGMHGCKDGQLQEIAGKTGGIFIKVKDASRLDTSMRTAALYSANYNLLSERYGAKHDTLCKILRIVFLTILGLFMIPLFYIANGIDDDSSVLMLVKSITALVSSIMLESMLRHFGTSLSTAHFFYCLLTSFVILQMVEISKQIINGNNTQRKIKNKRHIDLDDRKGQRLR